MKGYENDKKTKQNKYSQLLIAQSQSLYMRYQYFEITGTERLIKVGNMPKPYSLI